MGVVAGTMLCCRLAGMLPHVRLLATAGCCLWRMQVSCSCMYGVFWGLSAWDGNQVLLGAAECLLLKLHIRSVGCVQFRLCGLDWCLLRSVCLERGGRTGLPAAMLLVLPAVGEGEGGVQACTPTPLVLLRPQILPESLHPSLRYRQNGVLERCTAATCG